MAAVEFQEGDGQSSPEDSGYDVAVSFAEADRAVAERISRRLRAAGLRVCHDCGRPPVLLGEEDLGSLTEVIYYTDSRFTVVVVSRAYLEAKWVLDGEAFLAQMRERHGGHPLPYVMADVSVSGLEPALGHVASVDVGAEEFADMVVRRFRGDAVS